MTTLAVFLGCLMLNPLLAEESLILKVGSLMVGNGQILKNAVIVIKEGKISSVSQYMPNIEATTLDFSSGIATPGFIAANASMNVTPQKNEEMSEITPSLNLIHAVDPQSPDFAKAWKSGVTCVYISPGNINVINGTGTILKTYGSKAQDMLVKNNVHVKVVMGNEPGQGNSYPRRPGQSFTMRTRRPMTRMGSIYLIRNELLKAQKNMDAPENQLEAGEILIRKVLNQEIPLRIRARCYLDIKSILRIVEEYEGFRWILEDGVDAYRYFDELKASRIPVIYGPVFKVKGRPDYSMESERYKAMMPVLMAKKGILFAFQNNEFCPINHLRDEAIYAVQLGLSEKDALMALTQNAARILGIDSNLGTVEKGKDADILIFSGNPFLPTSRLERVLINGKDLNPNE